MNKEMMKEFRCRRCGECCRGEGFVKAAEQEIIKMAEYLGLSVDKFKEIYVEPSLFNEYWLKEQPNRDCIFLRDNECMVNPVKPEQCREFPFSWSNTDSDSTCPAMREILRKKAASGNEKS